MVDWLVERLSPHSFGATLWIDPVRSDDSFMLPISVTSATEDDAL